MNISVIKVFGLVLLSSIFACEKERVPLYEVNMDADFDIQSGLNTIATHVFIIRNVPTNYKVSADNRGVDTSRITNIQSSRGLMRAKFGNADYDFISRVSVYARSRVDTSQRREMYYLDFVPLETNEELRMLSSTSELKEILKEEYIDLEVRLNFRSFTGPTLPTRMVFGYAVF
jgi:hypothetical protein